MISIKNVFVESVFIGQRYLAPDGQEYDVPALTAWCQENLPVMDIPLASLIMSRSDEEHGSKEFKKHAAKVDYDRFPIVTCLRSDGSIQIADGNHRAWSAADDGRETIRGYVVPESSLPSGAIVGGIEG
jgi:hypothetical protein